MVPLIYRREVTGCRRSPGPGAASERRRISALGIRRVSPDYPGKHQRRGVCLRRIQRDRILQEALAARGPLHLSLVFNIDHTNAMAYAIAARNLLTNSAGQALSRRPE